MTHTYTQTRKKLSMRVISVLSALAMLFSFLPQSRLVFAEPIDDGFVHFTVTVNGLETTATVDNDYKFQVAVAVTIDDDYHDRPQTIEIDYDLGYGDMCLPVYNGTFMYKNEPAGTYEVDADGIIHFIITSQKFINDSNKEFALSFDATIHAEPDENGSDEHFSVDIGDEHYEITVVFPPSELEVTKGLAGPAYTDEYGNILQDYYLELKATQGKVTNIEITDIMGEMLSFYSPNDVRVYRDWDWSSSYDNNYEYPSGFGENSADNEIYIDLDQIDNNETVRVVYTLQVDPAYLEYGYDRDEGVNTFDAKFLDQKGDNGDPITGNKVYPNIDRPSIDKSGHFTADGKRIIWTITIDVGMFEEFDDNKYDFFKEFIDAIWDIPGSGIDTSALPVDDQGRIALKARDFTANGDGTYTLTYETAITDAMREKLNSVGDSVTITNKAILDGNDFDATITATVTKDGIGVGDDVIFEKKAVNAEPVDGKLQWEADMTLPGRGIDQVIFTDTATGGHKVVKDSITIGGQSLSELEASGYAVYEDLGDTFKITFTEAYLNSLGIYKECPDDDDRELVSSLQVVIKYDTVPEDEIDPAAGFNFNNKATMEYGDITRDAEASYEGEPQLEQIFVKFYKNPPFDRPSNGNSNDIMRFKDLDDDEESKLVGD